MLDVLRNADGISAVPNNAAYYLFPKYNAKRFGIIDDHAFGMGLLKHTRALIMPGSGFDYPDSDHFRIVTLPKPAQLKQAIVDYLHSLNR